MRKIMDFQQIKEYFTIPEEAIRFLECANADTACGRYEFSDLCYINVVDSQTKTEMEPMEAHEKFVDVQCLLVGKEKIFYTDKSALAVTMPYNESKDIAFFDFTDADTVCYRAGEGIVLYPNEAHLPGRACKEIMFVKKAVVKLKYPESLKEPSEFLRCPPVVFVIGKEYEILINTIENGLCAVELDGKLYYEENAGTLSTEKTYAKIRVPQEELNRQKRYSVVYRKAVDRRSYFSLLGEEQRESFEFHPLEKTDDIHIYHIADVHYGFEIAKRTASFFGDSLDLLVINGDIGEVETEQNYFEVCQFVGEISKGKVPVIFARGNHDTRGRLAERFTDYFPADGKNTYYEFEVGCLRGIVLDCGEDKPDVNEEYGGVNDFESFRRRETEFLKKLVPMDGKLTFAVSHICPAQNIRTRGSVFDIEDEIYRAWNHELDRLSVKFMLSGHIHQAYILEKNSPESLRPHGYPVVVGSARLGSVREGTADILGAALTLRANTLTVQFTDRFCTVRETHVLSLSEGILMEE